jgi:hypothetical protein
MGFSCYFDDSFFVIHMFVTGLLQCNFVPPLSSHFVWIMTELSTHINVAKFSPTQIWSADYLYEDYACLSCVGKKEEIVWIFFSFCIILYYIFFSFLEGWVRAEVSSL